MPRQPKGLDRGRLKAMFPPRPIERSNAFKAAGAVAQLVRVPDCRSGGCGFESRPPRLKTALA